MENLSQVTDKLYHRILYRVHSAWMGFELTMLANSTFYWSACTNPGLSERSCIYVFRSIILSLFLSFCLCFYHFVSISIILSLFLSFFYYILELFWFLSFYSNYTIYIILSSVLDTTLCDTVCQWHATGRWFSPGIPVFCINKTNRKWRETP